MQSFNFWTKWFGFPTKLFSDKDYYVLLWSQYLKRRVILLLIMFELFLISSLIIFSIFLFAFFSYSNLQLGLYISLICLDIFPIMFLCYFFFMYKIEKQKNLINLIFIYANWIICLTYTILLFSFVYVNYESEFIEKYLDAWCAFIFLELIIPLILHALMLNSVVYATNIYLNKLVDNKKWNINLISKNEFESKWTTIKLDYFYWDNNEHVSNNIEFIGVGISNFSKRKEAKYFFKLDNKIYKISFCDENYFCLFGSNKKEVNNEIIKLISSFN